MWPTRTGVNLATWEGGHVDYGHTPGNLTSTRRDGVWWRTTVPKYCFPWYRPNYVRTLWYTGT